MTERPDNTRLHDWLDDTVGQIPDPIAGTRQMMMSQIQETPQAGRWLPFPVFRRKAKAQAPNVTDTTEWQPSPIPALNGHTPTVIGRTQTMFSPSKALIAGALVFGIGGAMLIAQPFGQQGGTAPGAESADYVEPVRFTAVFTPGPEVSRPTCEVIGGMTQCIGIAWSPYISEVSDPRLDGVMTVSQNQNQYPLQPWLLMETYRIANDDGAWQGSFPSMSDGSVFGSASVVLVGEGAYEGLYAWTDVSDWSAISGVIFPAPPPEAPAPPAAE